MLKAQQGVAGIGIEEDMGEGAEDIVKTEPGSHSETASVHESSDSGKEDDR
jgi:hypothetical protein